MARRGVWKYDKETRQCVPYNDAAREFKPLPHIITDEIAPIESMATAKREIFTSKRKLYDHYKEHGVVVKEKGMQEVEPKRPEPDIKEIRDDIAMLANKLRWNEIQLTEKEKAICQTEQREFESYKRRLR